jgi:hypothetical protein
MADMLKDAVTAAMLGDYKRFILTNSSTNYYNVKLTVEFGDGCVTSAPKIIVGSFR